NLLPSLPLSSSSSFDLTIFDREHRYGFYGSSVQPLIHPLTASLVKTRRHASAKPTDGLFCKSPDFYEAGSTFSLKNYTLRTFRFAKARHLVFTRLRTTFPDNSCNLSSSHLFASPGKSCKQIDSQSGTIFILTSSTTATTIQ